MVLLPERDEAEDLLGFFALAQVGVGVTEGAAFGVVCEKDQNAWLASAAGGDVVILDDGMLAVVRDGVEVEIKGGAGEELFTSDLSVPSGQELVGLGRVDTMGVLCEVALLGYGVESAEQCQSLIGDERHDVALAFQRPEFECQAGAQGMGGRDHLRAWQCGGLSELLNAEPQEIRQEEEEPAAAGGKASWSQREVGEVGDGFDGGAWPFWSFLVQASGQGSKPFLLEHLAYGGGTEAQALFSQDLADLIDRMILLTQSHDTVEGGRLFGAGLGPWRSAEKELRVRLAAKLVAQNAEGAWGVAEIARHVAGRSALEEVGPEGLVHALLGGKGFGEEASALS